MTLNFESFMIELMLFIKEVDSKHDHLSERHQKVMFGFKKALRDADIVDSIRIMYEDYKVMREIIHGILNMSKKIFAVTYK